MQNKEKDKIVEDKILEILKNKEHRIATEYFLDKKLKRTKYASIRPRCRIKKVLKKLLKEKKTYTEIAEETGASTATISRVNRCLNYGSDGYSIILDRINSEKVVNK